MKKFKLKKVITLSLALVMSFSLSLPTNITNAVTNDINIKNTQESKVPNKVLVGYWHNFDNGTGKIRLRDVSPDWDVINLSFGVGTSVTSGEIVFSPFNATDEEFISDIKYLQKQGKKIILSIGGAEGQVRLETTEARDKFIKSVCGIIDKYGLDGLDIDFEGHSLSLDEGDMDVKNPTTPLIINTIDALKGITKNYGDDFILTMAPETYFVQMGYKFYGGKGNSSDRRQGAYLPVIYALRDELDWLQVQYYNSIVIDDLNGTTQNMGTPSFYVALADMLLKGFPIMGDENNYFPALRPDQVVLGVPTCSGAGGGWVSNDGVKQAFEAIMNGGTVGGYTIEKGYPDIRGLMTWSINWDKFEGYKWSTYFGEYFDKIDPPVCNLDEAIVTPSVVTRDSKYSLDITITSRNSASSYKIFENGTQIDSGSLKAGDKWAYNFTKEFEKKDHKKYEYKVVLYDSQNNSVTTTVVVDSTPPANKAPEFSGVYSREITKGTTFNALSGVTATDDYDGDVTKNIKATGNVDTNTLGTYPITYTVTDSDGDTMTSIIEIIVTNKTELSNTFIYDKVYNGGEIVYYEGVKYKCLWWSQYQIPSTSGNFEKIENTNIVDLGRVASKYASKQGDSKYESICDLNNDGKIDLYDLVAVCKTI